MTRWHLGDGVQRLKFRGDTAGSTSLRVAQRKNGTGFRCATLSYHVESTTVNANPISN